MNDYRKDFPLLSGSNIAYLDNAATAQRPLAVLDAVKSFYEKKNANPLRGIYDLSTAATEAYENARITVQKFIHAAEPCKIIFTRNTTESINLAAYSYGLENLTPDDEILVTIAEHHSNLLPWQAAARKTGARLKFLECNSDGSFSQDAVDKAVTKHTRLAAVIHISNVTGRESPIGSIISAVHRNGGIVLIDGAQSVPHISIDVQSLDADFFAFSGHKLMSPMGIGVLYGKKHLLEKMPPFLTGGEMIESVSRESAVYAPLPHKFEAGTVNAGGAVGLAAAISYIESIGFEKIGAIENELTDLALTEMSKIPHLHIIGSEKAAEHNGIISFTVDGVHPHDIAEMLNVKGVAVRAGHHCAQHLLKHLGVMSAARASIAFYNTEDDIMKFTVALRKLRRLMGYGE